MREKNSTEAGSSLRGWSTAFAAVIALTTVLGCQSTTANEGKTADASSPLASTDPAGRLAVVVDGKSVAPIVVFKDAPPLTRQAADELAYYIEKVSGAKPQVIEGEPASIPEHAVWVGYQPVLDELFPDLDFDFQYPGEILIAANADHVVIAGRDVWDPDGLVITNKSGKAINGVQQEYGTHNAVYTFLRDQLGIRWLWPGERDIPDLSTIALEPFVYRYHPQIRARGGLLAYCLFERTGSAGPEDPAFYSGGPRSAYWLRAQRLQLSELRSLGGHGPWNEWWVRFHETNPEFFALQPNRTRGGVEKPPPGVKKHRSNVKMCESNPDIVPQWLDDVEEELKQNPNKRVFNVSPLDGWTRGHCICEACRAWDHPDGAIRSPFIWEGMAQEYVALTDRDVKFANRLARSLKERFPDKELYVYLLAYGHSRPAPIEAVPDDNVIIGNVANFLLRSDMHDRGSTTGVTHRENYKDWGKVTKLQFWRPNTGSPVGWQTGLPDVPFQRTIDDIKFAAEHGAMGIYVDYVREHWSTQAPMYYLMAHLIWDPYQDGQAVLDDFYARAYGPAAGEMKAYWTYLEKIREECYGTEKPGAPDHDPMEFYNEQRVGKAFALLDKAKQAVQGAPKYLRRVEFARVGLEFTKLYTEIVRLMERVRGGEDADGTGRAKVIANWDRLRTLQQEHPKAMMWRKIFGESDASGPPPRNLYPHDEETTGRGGKAAAGAAAVPTSTRTPSVGAEWKLVFEDRFDRDELGDGWRVTAGKWEIVDGTLRGSGAIVSTRGFPGGDEMGFQRMEFEAVTDVQTLDILGTGDAATHQVGDISSMLHVKWGADSEGSPLKQGYFFQFGGFLNTRNKVFRAWKLLKEERDPAVKIVPGKVHKIVVENDGGALRLTVDGTTVLSHKEDASILGGGHDKVGLYCYTDCKIRNVKVYVKTVEEELGLE